jgi:hypothetical protein
MRGLQDRTVLVTGAANGIGAAIARRLAQEGCSVGIVDLDAPAGEKVAGEISNSGGRASLHIADITEYKAVSRVVETFESACGPLACLVNNAGWDRAANFLDTPPELWRGLKSMPGWQGQVVSIYITPKPSGEMVSVQKVRAFRDRGLEGDRFFRESWNAAKRPDKAVIVVIGDGW